MSDSATQTAAPARRARGDLEQQIKQVVDLFALGKLTVEDGKKVTPFAIAKAIQQVNNLDARPSTGAVTACLKRWEEIGFITVSESPYAFESYTEAARTEGLAALKAKAKEAKRAAKAAAKADAASAPIPPPAPTTGAPKLGSVVGAGV